MRDIILAEIAEQLDLGGDAVDPSQSFIDYGLGSNEAVFLCGAIEEKIGQPVYIVLVFECQTIQDFIEAVAKQYHQATGKTP